MLRIKASRLGRTIIGTRDQVLSYCGVLPPQCDRAAAAADLSADLMRRRVQVLSEPGRRDAYVARFVAAHPPYRGAAMLVRDAVSTVVSSMWGGSLGGMLLGSQDWTELLNRSWPDRPEAPALLDIGAGNGKATAHLAAGLGGTGATAGVEVSAMCRARLRMAGLAAHRSVDEARRHSGPFDAVSMFNLLDRCECPRRMLADAAAATMAGGRVIVALRLPLEAYVWSAGGAITPQSGSLDTAYGTRGQDGSWYAHLGALVADVEADTALGLEVVSWCRAPYLLQSGDAAGDGDFTAMDTALLVLRRRGGGAGRGVR